MASKFVCICGEVIRTNLYEGNDIKFIVPEECTDIDETDDKNNLTKFIERIIIESQCFLECKKCGRIAVIDKDYKIRMYNPIQNDSEE